MGKKITTFFWALGWLRILPAGAMVALSTFAFVYLTVYAYVVSYPVFGRSDAAPDRLDRVVTLVSVWGARVFFLMLALLVASWVSRRAGESATLHGVLVGVVAAVFHQAIVYFLIPPVKIDEASLYLVLGVAGGWLGGVQGSAALAGQEALYLASQRIGKARDPDTVAAAVGEQLGGSDVSGVALWRAVSETGHKMLEGEPVDAFELWASWTPGANEGWPAGSRLEATRLPALAHLADRRSAMLLSKDLPTAERTDWEGRGVRMAFLVPLATPGDELIGLLVVTFRRRRRLSRGATREYLTIGAQAALALENLRLMEETRQVAVFRERQRMAREIHDTLAQGFTSIAMSLTAAELAETGEYPESDNSEIQGSPRWHVERARRTAGESLKEAQRLVWALRPEALDRHPLPEALERLAEGWSEDTGVEAHAATTGEPRPLLPEAEVTLLRASQEALSNVRKHANASRVALTISYMDDIVVLDVRDNGVGFDPAYPKTGTSATVNPQGASGFGLVAMRERAEQLGGTLLIESTPEKGTTLVVELPAAMGTGGSSGESKPTGTPARRTETLGETK